MISDWLELATYWNSCGLYQDKANELNKLIPISGNCSDSKLELFRVMSSAYYDIYNNKACNSNKFYELQKQIVEHYDEIKELTDFSNIESTKLFDWINYAANNEDFYAIDFDYDIDILRLIERLMDAIVVISYVATN